MAWKGWWTAVVCGVAGCAIGAMFHAGEARAIVFGNPVPEIRDGEKAAGVSLGEDGITLFADFGVSKAGVAQVLAGMIDKGNADGWQAGAGYRHRLDAKARLEELDVAFGAFAGARYGSLESGDASLIVVDVGAGATISPVKQLYLFGGPVFRWARVDVDGGKGQGGSDTDTDLGIFIGAEYWFQPRFAAGIELHGGIEDESLAIYAEYKF